MPERTSLLEAVVGVVDSHAHDPDGAESFCLVPLSGAGLTSEGEDLLTPGLRHDQFEVSQRVRVFSDAGTASRAGVGLRTLALLRQEHAGNGFVSPDEPISLVTVVDGWALIASGSRPLNLQGADLSGADLTGAALRDSDLTAATLARADLYRSDFRRATLRSANLQGARIQRANLIEADLTYADLRRADLSDSDLREAELSGASLRGAELWGTFIGGVDLSRAYLDGVDLERADNRQREKSEDTSAPPVATTGV